MDSNRKNTNVPTTDTTRKVNNPPMLIMDPEDLLYTNTFTTDTSTTDLSTKQTQDFRHYYETKRRLQEINRTKKDPSDPSNDTCG